MPFFLLLDIPACMISHAQPLKSQKEELGKGEIKGSWNSLQGSCQFLVKWSRVRNTPAQLCHPSPETAALPPQIKKTDSKHWRRHKGSQSQVNAVSVWKPLWRWLVCGCRSWQMPNNLFLEVPWELEPTRWESYSISFKNPNQTNTGISCISASHSNGKLATIGLSLTGAGVTADIVLLNMLRDACKV